MTRWLSRATMVAAALGLAAPGTSPAAPTRQPEVTMFGASWCGPCRSLRQYFAKNGIRYTYRDVDEPANAEAFRVESRGSSGIPLTMVGRQRIRGFNPAAIAKALGRRGPTGNDDDYGGRTAQEWQAEFRELRRFIESLDVRVRTMKRVAADELSKAEVRRMERSLEIAKASLRQLDVDASRVSLPRSYRR